MPAPYRSPIRIRNDLREKLRRNRKIAKSNLDMPCWEWTGNRAKNGYGRVYVPKDMADCRLMYVHILSYLLFHRLGDTGGLAVCHRCDNPPCFRPGHLFLGTVSDNNSDMKMKGRHAYGERTGNSILTSVQVRKIRKLLKTTSLTQKEIGKIMGISQSHVSYIKNYGWKILRRHGS
jgi:predicted XRE-type DNA-binding protein